MTDKITTGEAIRILKDEIIYINSMIYPSDMETTMWVANRVNALEMAIKALEQNEKLKSIIREWYGQGIDEVVDNVACKHCEKRVDGKCSLDDSEPCFLNEDETLELFFKYGLE